MMAAIIKDDVVWICIKLTTDGEETTPFDQNIHDVLFHVCELSVRLAFMNQVR
jgi:hypothetical protein